MHACRAARILIAVCVNQHIRNTFVDKLKLLLFYLPHTAMTNPPSNAHNRPCKPLSNIGPATVWVLPDNGSPLGSNGTATPPRMKQGNTTPTTHVNCTCQRSIDSSSIPQSNAVKWL